MDPWLLFSVDILDRDTRNTERRRIPSLRQMKYHDNLGVTSLVIPVGKCA